MISFSLSSFHHLYFYFIEIFLFLGIGAELACIFVHQKSIPHIQRSVSLIKFFNLFENYIVMLVLIMILTNLFAENRLPIWTGTQLSICILTGIIATVLFLLTTKYYSYPSFRPVISIAKASTTGQATNIIQGLAISMEATTLPTIIICASILINMTIAGVGGLTITAITMMALSFMIFHFQSYQGYAIGSACLTSLVLFLLYLIELPHYFSHIKFDFVLQNPFIVIGLFIGGVLTYLFSGLFMLKGIKIIIQFILPFLLFVIVPILFFVIIYAIADLGSAFASLGALLLGAMITGFLVATSMNSGGASWNQVKKYIDEGQGKNEKSLAYEASVTGDKIGFVYQKITSPVLGFMIKTISMTVFLLMIILARF